MSNAGQAALGIVGGIIGFAVGGPAGAAYGLQIGLAVGTVVSPTQLPGTFGPRLNDKRTTTAQLGEPITEIFGIDTVAGTVIWLGDIVEHAETEEVGGKGGPEGENTTFTYTQSIAVGLCRGPQLGVLRIWENGKLVYDARPQFEDESDEAFEMRFTAAGEYAEGFTIYLGDEEQLPDPTIELKEGVGNVPAYRGLMYIVYHDRLLRDDQGQRHPSFKFEIAASPLPDLRQADAETLRSSFIVRAGSDFLGNAIGFSDIPFISHGDCFDVEIPGAPGNVAIVGGFEVDVALCRFDGVIFGPQSFGLEIHDFFEGLITQVEFAGPDFLGTPTIFTPPTSQGTFFRSGDPRTSVEFSPVVATPFIVGEDYLVTVTSTLPAGRLSDVELTAASVSPLGAPVIGYNSPEADAVYNSLGVFGSFVGTVDVGEVDEVAVRGLYVETAANNLRLLLQGNFSGLKLVLRFEGEDGPVIFGPTPGVTNGTGITRWDWDVPVGTLAALNTYAIEVRGVGVVPADAPVNLPPTLANIVESICARCALDLVDVSDLEEVTVYGYKIDRLTDGRSAIAVLRQIGFFDAVESGGLVKFVRRGKPPARTLTAAELGAHQYGADVPPAVTTRSTQDVELPRQLFVQYRDPARDYEDGQQASPTRLITDAVNDTYIDVAVAISGTQALQAAEILWADMWANRWQHTIAIDAANADLEPTDVILVPVDGRLERMRITSIEDSAVVMRQLALVRDDDGSYVSAAIAEPPASPPQPLGILAGTALLLMDLPPLRSTDNDAGVYAAAQRTGAGNRWGGAAIYRGLPGGALSPIASATNEAVVGTLSMALPSGPHTVWDDGNEIVVELPRGQFESRTDTELLEDGANTLAVGAHGRWELVQFGDAMQVGPTTWVLSHLLRGRRGTEHNIGTGQVGDSVALVSGFGIVRLPLPVAEVTGDRVYRGVTIGATLASGTDQTFASAGETLKPFSPVHVMASDAGGGDTLIEWTRRDRLAIEFTDPLPLSEASEAYEIDILADSSPVTVLRTLTSSTPSVVYTAAQRLDDFGSPGPSAIAVRIYQMGLLGRGHPAEAMI